MPDEKVFSIQPRFKMGDTPSGWGFVSSIFKLGSNLPPYGSDVRDTYLSYEWQNEPMLAGVFSTWIEKVQTLNWKVTGTREQADEYAKMFQNADNGMGWTYHEGVGAIDFLSTDKGACEELGRKDLDPATITELQNSVRTNLVNPLLAQNSYANLPADPNFFDNLEKLGQKASFGPVGSIQHLDSTRLIRAGLPGMRFRYYPEQSRPVSIPDDNIIQIIPMPSARDRFAGNGYCVLSRVIDAKQLMVGYLTYYRQEIGNLPPELIAIINGMDSTTFQDALSKYKMEREQKSLDTYSKIFWLGTDDPLTPVTFTTTSLINSTKSFQWKDMVEWWMKTLALNCGEDIGEFWLLQRGESKTVQSIQAMKSRAKGVARYVQEKERKYNLCIMPYGTRFQYDNPDDEADRLQIEILASKINALAGLAAIGVDRQDPVFDKEELRKIAVDWEILPPEVSGVEAPAVLGAMLKQLYGTDLWQVDNNYEWKKLTPLITKGKDAEQAEFLFKYLGSVYSNNGFIKKEKEVIGL